LYAIQLVDASMTLFKHKLFNTLIVLALCAVLLFRNRYTSPIVSLTATKTKSDRLLFLHDFAKPSRKACEATQIAEEGGFGSQYQNIIQTALYAHWKGKSFCVTPITSIHGNYGSSSSFLREVNELLHLAVLPAEQFYCLFVHSCRTASHVDFIENKKAWFDDFIKDRKLADFAKPFLQGVGKRKRTHSGRESEKKNAVVHIRRRNPQDIEDDFHGRNHLQDRDICHAMRLVQAANPSITFEIYSQGEHEDFGLYGGDPRISLHLNEALNVTFLQMVQADVLIMAKSSLSYTAGLLREGEVWAPNPFWHTFPYYWKTFDAGKGIPEEEPCLIPAN